MEDMGNIESNERRSYHHLDQYIDNIGLELETSDEATLSSVLFNLRLYNIVLSFANIFRLGYVLFFVQLHPLEIRHKKKRLMPNIRQSI